MGSTCPAFRRSLLERVCCSLCAEPRSAPESHASVLHALQEKRPRCAVSQADAPRQPCMWQLRSHEEAAAAWQAEFGHLDVPSPAPGVAGAKQGAAKEAGSGSGDQTMVYAVARSAVLFALGTPEGCAGVAERSSMLDDQRVRGQRADALEGSLDGRASGHGRQSSVDMRTHQAAGHCMTVDAADGARSAEPGSRDGMAWARPASGYRKTGC